MKLSFSLVACFFKYCAKNESYPLFDGVSVLNTEAYTSLTGIIMAHDTNEQPEH